jgi:restriction endonuclease S subunit
MRDRWGTVKISDVVFQDFESAIKVIADKEYPMVGVYSYGKGLFNRERLLGINTSYKTFYKLKPNHIVFSQLFGWEGAIALCPEKFAGKYVSSQFPTFLIRENFAEPKYVFYYLMQGYIWKKLYEVGIGMGSRRRTLNPSNLLNLSIPLPPLAEQQRIVAHIESVQSRIEQIRQLRAEQEKEIEILRNIIFIDLYKKQKTVSIGAVLIPHKEIVPLKADKIYKQVTVKMEHKGILLRGTMKGKDIGSKQFLAKKGDFIISKIDARNGAMGRIPAELNESVVTNDFPLYTFSDKINPDFFNHFSNTLYFDNACKHASEGTTNRKRLKIDKFENIQIPLPPIDEQNRIVAFLEKFSQIRQLYKEQEAELSALMPSLLNKVFNGELIKDEKEASIIPLRNYELESEYFVKRKMLGAYIINQSLNDEKFGDTKFEKLMHLAEYWAVKRNFNQQYYKQAAGPYDNRFTLEFYDQIQQAKWFVIQKYKNKQTRIIAGENHAKSQNYYGYFSENELAKINELINYFKACDYKEPEIVSTLYAVWNNRIKLRQAISDELLIQDFYDWAGRKAIYTKDKVEHGLNWMREKGIVPDGWGEVIEKVGKRNKISKIAVWKFKE